MRLFYFKFRYLLTLLQERPTDEEIDEMIRMVDMDGIGQVGLEEFMNLMEKGSITGEMVKVKVASDKVKKELHKMVEQDEEISMSNKKGPVVFYSYKKQYIFFLQFLKKKRESSSYDTVLFRNCFRVFGKAET